MFFKTDHRLMQVKSIAECSKRETSAILATFIKLPVIRMMQTKVCAINGEGPGSSPIEYMIRLFYGKSSSEKRKLNFMSKSTGILSKAQ